jgi:hypothetical protein
MQHLCSASAAHVQRLPHIGKRWTSHDQLQSTKTEAWCCVASISKRLLVAGSGALLLLLLLFLMLQACWRHQLKLLPQQAQELC